MYGGRARATDRRARRQRNGVTRSHGPQDGRQSGLASGIVSVDERQLRKVPGRRGAVVEDADAVDPDDFFEHFGFPASRGSEIYITGNRAAGTIRIALKSPVMLCNANANEQPLTSSFYASVVGTGGPLLGRKRVLQL